jgi:hypothetical protein
VNAALPGAPDEILQQIFLNLVDSLTAWHLSVLVFVANPRAPLEDRIERLDALAPPTFPIRNIESRDPAFPQSEPVALDSKEREKRVEGDAVSAKAICVYSCQFEAIFTCRLL